MSYVMIVDDVVANLKVLSDMLKERGYNTRPVNSGQVALRAAKADPPSLILLDIRMPGMDGYEVCRQLKAGEQTRGIPIIFISALDAVDDKLKAFQAGGVDYVTKPFQSEEVLARVETHLTLRQLQTGLEELVAERTQALREAYRKLEKMDRNKTDFIEVAGHELRTPLTLIKGYLQILSVTATEETAEMLAGMVRRADRMHEVVNSMLDIARIDAESLEVCREAVSLGKTVTRIQEEFGPALEERRLSLAIGGAEGLPLIQADPDLLYKVFYHLIVNAIKYTPDGGTIEVGGSVVGEGAEVEIVVSDTGIGIDPDHHELIFEKFYQTGTVKLHSSGKTKFKGGGPGLGLAIARGIVLAHGGRIWVESEGHDEERCPGSRFYVRLPISTD